MRKAKRGSSLISVVIIFALLVIGGSALMVATLNGYKLRIRNNNRIKNLYASESGLEKSYANVSNLIDEATDKGNEAVDNYNKKELKEILEKEKVRLEEYINEKIKVEDNKTKNKWDSFYLNEDGSLKEENIYKKRNEIFKGNFKEHVKANILDKIENGEDNDKYKVKVETEPKFNDKEEMDIDVKSYFQSKDINRIVQTTFTLKTPDYNKVENYKTANISIKNIWTKALVAGKNLSDESNVEVVGDVYVYGKGPNSRGVIVAGNSKLDLRGRMVSLKDTSLRGANSQLVVRNTGESDEELGKIFTGSLLIDKGSINSNINVDGQVYASNDLILNGEKSNIKILKGLYGINDVGAEIGDKNEQAKNSSCIIVNVDDIGKGSSITIENEAILMGTAYINVDPVYQTGESIAIKGNYRAYGAPLQCEEYNKDKMVFEYRHPLQLVTKFQDARQLLYTDKEKYLEEYIKEYKSFNINNGQGIKLPKNTVTVGAIFHEGTFEKGNYTIDNERIKICRDKYLTATNELMDIEQEINFSNIENVSKVENYTDGKEIIYLNNSSAPCVLAGEGEKNYGDIELGKKSRGIIITNGDVYIKGNIEEFRGTIITSGNIIVQGKEAKKIIYDSNYVKRLIASNYALFKDIFIGTNLSNQVVRWEQDDNGNNKLTDGYLRQKLLKSKNWKIIK